ncbi:MAG: glutathione S-transferase [Porticoccus sp.]|nr:glutathione S-transferase [Porticoccus sp.]MBQ0808059.1 glutathione S-transferase [Porticoccus sp.]
MLPILYSFRRCPYAIRARMALAYAGVQVELREILLREKPPQMLAASTKGTVPVLVLPDGSVLEESYDVMRWALNHHDPDHWCEAALAAEANALIDQNDHSFKAHLDHYKYADRHPEHPMEYYRTQAEGFLQILEAQLTTARFLLGEKISVADVGIFPFIRQFAFVDKSWFDQAPYPNLQNWLAYFLNSALFLSVMEKYPVWQEGSVIQPFPE